MAEHEASTRRTPVVPSPLSAVVVHGDDIGVSRAHHDVATGEARSRFGGVDPLAVLGGALAGLGSALVLGGLAAALGLKTAQDADGLAWPALLTALVVLALSALAAGAVAGRMARYDGARNGLLAGLLMSALLALMGAAGAYSAADGGLPVSLDGDSLGRAALVTALAGLAVSLLAGLLGGRLGSRWHRHVDDVLVGTRPGAVASASRSEVVR